VAILRDLKLSWDTKLELNFGAGETPNLESVRDEVLAILEKDGISSDALVDLLSAFEHHEGRFNLVGAYVAQFLKEVAPLIPGAWIEARISGEEFRDTVILQFEDGEVTFESGPWPYD
jgi:hypothetical protein